MYKDRIEAGVQVRPDQMFAQEVQDHTIHLSDHRLLEVRAIAGLIVLLIQEQGQGHRATATQVVLAIIPAIANQGALVQVQELTVLATTGRAVHQADQVVLTKAQAVVLQAEVLTLGHHQVQVDRVVQVLEALHRADRRQAGLLAGLDKTYQSGFHKPL